MHSHVLSRTDPTLRLENLESVTMYSHVLSFTDPTLGLENLESVTMYSHVLSCTLMYCHLLTLLWVWKA